ncbi:Carbon storage regulator [hydrothermal vent metagenome]|uniref:Carbon storage regulator n=1 Tax=hydrothermal vent metagenome TaxID=652676 RepID=A0A3B0YG31_9ZZZZ
MLILTRRIDETLMIGDDIQVTVRGIKGSQISIGIEAPKAVAVMREELLTHDRNQTIPPAHPTRVPAA